MRFSTPSETLLNAVQIAERIVGKKESLPVLSCILLEVGEQLLVKSTNLEAGVSISVGGEVGEKGTVAVPAAILTQTLKAVSGGKVTLSLDAGNLLLSARGSKTLIKAVPHEEFPAFSVGGNKKGVTLKRETILSSIQSVSYAASTSMIRPELGSVFISMKDSRLVCVATDSFRLAEKTITDASGKGDYDILVPLKHAHEMMHILDRVQSPEINLAVEDSQLHLSADSVTYVSRTVDANFPNYREIIPKSFTTEATLLKSDFIETLRKARVFSGADQHIGFHVYPKKKIFDATAQSASIGEMSDSLEAALSGEDIDVNFHIGYVAECLQSILADSIVLGFSGAGKPLVIRGVSDATFTYLVMPLNR